MNRIHVLSDLLVNKIAAGEVIERPASVLKELMENSIDAGATRIDVTLEDGGKRLVRVADDGCGMAEQDLALAVRPHATSKIATEDDLFAIGTMGFRGEALPSIGSVSRLRIVSRMAGEPGGSEITVAGDRTEGVRPVAAAPGTTVEVRDLFFNVPARRKFLRATTTELGHISEQIVRIGLAHPHVHVTCTHNTRQTHDLAACGGPDIAQAFKRRIADLFGAELAESLIGIDRRDRGLRVAGWVARPSETRGTGAWQYTWLNGRFIRDRFVQHAIRESYRGLLPEGRFPVVFLFLQTDPADVVVNVHPTKIEVRFRDSNLVHSQVLAALRETFLSRDLTASLGDRSFSPVRSAEAQLGGFPRSPGIVGGAAGHLHRESLADLSPSRQEEVRRAMADFLQQMPLPRTAPPEVGAPSLEVSQGPFPPRLPHGSARGPGVLQIHNTYLVAESEDGLIIVDQHALHERIIYQKLVDRFGRGTLESQRLLLPETVEVTPAELACLSTFGELLERLGLDVTPFGPSTVAIQAVPSVLNDAQVSDWVVQLLRRLTDKPDQEVTDEFVHELLDMMACKAAVKAGDPLTAEEIETLLRQRTAVEKASACPHGRPTTLRLTLRDLEKQFKRS